jgi:hypothetical protein
LGQRDEESLSLEPTHNTRLTACRVLLIVQQEMTVEWSDPGKGGAWVLGAVVPLTKDKEKEPVSLTFKRKFSFF